MAKKRKSGGKTGSSKGRHQRVQCSECGRSVPKSKATVLRGGSRLVDDKTRKILKDAGTVIINQPHKRYLCVSCSVHRGVTPQRREEKRR